MGAAGVGKVSQSAGNAEGAREGGGGRGVSSEGRWRVLDIGLELLQSVVKRGNMCMWAGEVGEGVVAAAAETAWSLIIRCMCVFVCVYLFVCVWVGGCVGVRVLLCV